MAQKKVSAFELAKAKEAMKKEKRISGSASGKLQSPNSNLMTAPIKPWRSSTGATEGQMAKSNSVARRTGGIVGAGAAAVNKLYRNMGN